ncbi:hypothetical protein Metal_1258 [Methylomicrobium album BG8]|uniref:Uncharacterized protein n=1 Tax=Methylomicrobium album BG8 TaxID=686340 RepID=H8GIN2_METAL|nr:hypothetical protein Metal_1258 [Methylomicrobium album BG8]
MQIPSRAGIPLGIQAERERRTPMSRNFHAPLLASLLRFAPRAAHCLRHTGLPASGVFSSVPLTCNNLR